MSSCRLVLPSTLYFPLNTPGFNNQILSSASHRLAYIFSAADSAFINALGIRLGAIIGTTSTYTIEIQGVDANGFPDGTGLIGSSATFSPSALGWTAGSFNWIAIPGVNLTRGAFHAITVRHASGTIDASNNASFSTSQSSVSPSSYGLPYITTDTGSGWAKTSTPDTVFAYRSSTQTYGSPIQNWINGSLATNGHRAALKLTFDSDWGATFKVRGLATHWMQSLAGGSYKMGIWNAAGAELAAVTIDSDYASQTALKMHRGFFSTAPTLNFGTTYYFGIERVAAVNNTPRYIEVSSNRDLEAYPFGTAANLATWDGTSWTDVITQLFPLTLYMETWNKPNTGFVSMITG